MNITLPHRLDLFPYSICHDLTLLKFALCLPTHNDSPAVNEKRLHNILLSRLSQPFPPAFRMVRGREGTP